MCIHPDYAYMEEKQEEQEKEDFLHCRNIMHYIRPFFPFNFSRHYVESEFQRLLLQQRQISSAADNKEFIFSQ